MWEYLSVQGFVWIELGDWSVLLISKNTLFVISLDIRLLIDRLHEELTFHLLTQMLRNHFFDKMRIH